MPEKRSSGGMRDLTPQATRPLSKDVNLIQHHRQVSNPTNNQTLLDHSYNAAATIQPLQRTLDVPASRRAKASSSLQKGNSKIQPMPTADYNSGAKTGGVTSLQQSLTTIQPVRAAEPGIDSTHRASQRRSMERLEQVEQKRSSIDDAVTVHNSAKAGKGQLANYQSTKLNESAVSAT